jgi:hypothetical protein
LKIRCGALNPGCRSQRKTLPRTAALRSENPLVAPATTPMFGAIEARPSRSTMTPALPRLALRPNACGGCATRLSDAPSEY